VKSRREALTSRGGNANLQNRQRHKELARAFGRDGVDGMEGEEEEKRERERERERDFGGACGRPLNVIHSVELRVAERNLKK